MKEIVTREKLIRISRAWRIIPKLFFFFALLLLFSNVRSDSRYHYDRFVFEIDLEKLLEFFFWWQNKSKRKKNFSRNKKKQKRVKMKSKNFFFFLFSLKFNYFKWIQSNRINSKILVLLKILLWIHFPIATDTFDI